MKCIHNYCSRFVAFGSLIGALFVAAATAQAQTCPSFPIALPAQMLDGLDTNTVITGVVSGEQQNNFGWLSWTGDQNQSTLVASLIAPGDSSSYVNPDDPTDNELDPGDWVTGIPPVSNRISLRNALSGLLGADINVPVFDDVRDNGVTVAYHIVGFAHVQLIDYHLPGQNTISVLFLGISDCSGGGDGGPGV